MEMVTKFKLLYLHALKNVKTISRGSFSEDKHKIQKEFLLPASTPWRQMRISWRHTWRTAPMIQVAPRLFLSPPPPPLSLVINAHYLHDR